MDKKPEHPEERRIEAGEEIPATGLHVRYVEDRRLSASVVLPELSEDRKPQGPVPVFVP